MSFKDFSIFSSDGPHGRLSGIICAILVELGHCGKHTCEIILNMIQEKMFLKKMFTHNGRWTTDEDRPHTIAHIEPSALVS